jgi:LuxR family maltose regulon positive regulatory protein
MNADISDISRSVRAPLAPGGYPRSDLHNLLDEANSRRLIVINGPPGAGKSTLIATYIATRNLPSIWYQVDNTDQDLATFFHDFGIAARQAMPHNKASLPDWHPAFVTDNTAFAKRYFQAIYHHLKAPFLVVLDDYQEVEDAAPLHDAICVACKELPPGGRMVIISTKGCPPTLARLCTTNMVAIIEPDDLRLN